MRTILAAALVVLAPMAAAQSGGEADVIGVDHISDGDTYTFWATIASSGDAAVDHWTIETLDGTELARYDLGSRTEPRFTVEGSATVTADAVVVRAHNTETGYGGQAVLIDLAGGRIATVDQGAEPDDFTGYFGGNGDAAPDGDTAGEDEEGDDAGADQPDGSDGLFGGNDTGGDGAVRVGNGSAVLPGGTGAPGEVTLDLPGDRSAGLPTVTGGLLAVVLAVLIVAAWRRR